MFFVDRIEMSMMSHVHRRSHNGGSAISQVVDPDGVCSFVVNNIQISLQISDFTS